MHPLVSRLLAGDSRALSRLMTLIENRSDGILQVMKEVQERCGQARTVGVTGPPGAGKSTLADKLIGCYRGEKRLVGVVAIDPSSPFSGGAVMGDRIRMQGHSGDKGVFIRSLGTRGSRGGLARATREMVKLYDAFGMEEVIVETVGVGQTELDIMAVAETTIVVLTPESGDTIQTMKAGILEIADIFAVNKADRPGALQMVGELKSMVEIGGGGKGHWEVPVLPLQARDGIGMEGLHAAIKAHRASVERSGVHSLRRARLIEEETREIILEELAKRLSGEGWFKEAVGDNPYASAEKILAKVSF